MTRGGLASLVAALLCTSSINAAPVQDQECTSPLFSYAPRVRPDVVWATRSDYAFGRINHDDGEEVFFVGDVLRISKEDFPFFFRRAGEPVTNIKKLKFDAREIVIDFPLRLADASVSLFADRISFVGDGALVLVRPPTTSDQVVEISTKELDLTRSSLFPLQFVTQDWRGGAWPLASGPQRRVKVRAGTVELPADLPETERNNLIHRPARFVHNMTLDRGRSRFEDWAKMYDVTIGEAARGEYEEFVRTVLMWPNRTASKIGDILSSAPYDPSVRTYVQRQAAEFAQRFSSRVDQAAYLRIETVRAAANKGEDLRRLSEYDVSLVSLPSLLDQYEKRLAAVFSNPGAGLAIWDDLIVNSMQSTSPNQEAVNALKSQAEALEGRIAQEENLVTTNIDRLAGISASITQELSLVEQRRAIARESAAAEQRRLRAANQIEEAGRVVQVAAIAVGTVFPAAAPIALGVSAAVGTAASLSAAHNRGKRLSLTAAITTFEEVHKAHEQHKVRIQELQKAWAGDPKAAEGSASRLGLKVATQEAAQYVKSGFKGDAEKLRRFVSAASSVNQLVRDINSQVLSPGKPIEVTMTNFEAKDTVLQQAMSRLSSLNAQEAALRAQIEQATTDKITVLSELGVARGSLDVLLAPAVTNAPANARQLDIALWHRERLIDGLRSEAAMLLRGYRYYSGDALDLPDRQTEMLNPPPPEVVELRSQKADDVRQSLSKSRQELQQSLEAISIGMRREVERRQASIGLRGLISKSFLATTERAKQAPEVAAFLRQVNQRILTQVSGENDTSLVPIPFLVEEQPANLPERVLEAMVSFIEFEDVDAASKGSIRFTVVHPGAGIVYYNRDCAVVRGIDAGGKPAVWERAWNYPSGPGKWDQRLDQLRLRLDNVAWEFSYPYRAQYYLRTEVMDRKFYDPAKPPVVKELRIDFAATSN